MLGELLWESKGRVTGQRVLEDHKVETSIQTSGKLLGIESREMGTYWSVMKPGGVLYAEGRGILMTKDGDNISWVGQGVGRFKAGGGVQFRGAVYYETASQKFARVNGVAGVFEYETDANDNTTVKVWEWK